MTNTEGAIFSGTELVSVIKRLKAGEFDNDPELKGVLLGVKELIRQEYGPFICGRGGEDIDTNLPEYLHICPAYGADIRATTKYRRLDDDK